MYTRETEIRHLQPNDVYKLGVILDDNNCWKKLMEIIPKYNNDHIRLIEDAIKRPGESRLFSQILFEEWGTSGRKHERPTVGVLLQLLIKAELFRAADFVAVNFLNEPPPPRPLNGPAARIDISLTSDIFDDIDDLVNDSSYYPGTTTLNDNANYRNSLTDNNKDFYSKYHNMDKHVNANDLVPPKPPPRTRSTRSQLQQQQQQTQHEAPTAAAVSNSAKEEMQQSNVEIFSENIVESQNVPKLSELMTQADKDSYAQSQNTVSTYLSEFSKPLLSTLTPSTDIVASGESRFLPIISALNINGEQENHSHINDSMEATTVSSVRQSSNASSSSLSNDSIDDDELPVATGDMYEEKLTRTDESGSEDGDNEGYEDNSVPNLSIFEQRSSNNDSSLTNVTGTSEESSFELSMNDISTASNDENIPCLSALK